MTECSDKQVSQNYEMLNHESQPRGYHHQLESTSKKCPTSLNNWCDSDEYDPQAIFVDLEKNAETYTAYDGTKIWNAIY